jgi:hypothetical protein
MLNCKSAIVNNFNQWLSLHANASRKALIFGTLMENYTLALEWAQKYPKF